MRSRSDVFKDVSCMPSRIKLVSWPGLLLAFLNLLTVIAKQLGVNQDMRSDDYFEQDCSQLDDQSSKLCTLIFDCDETIESLKRPNGTFMSPFYPNPYPRNIECKFTFIGRGRERVQIQFVDFDLRHPAGESTECYCRCDLKLKEAKENSDDRFDDHDLMPQDSSSRFCCVDVDMVEVSTFINGDKADIDDYCGSLKEPKIQVMSNGPKMIVTFRSFSSAGAVSKDTHRGFKANFNFVTNFGILSGEPSLHSTCGFIYNSTMTKNGTFNSPNWPGRYPRNTECTYYFFASINPPEVVRLSFQHFDVEGIYPCLAKTESDYVEFSNFETVDRKLPRYCGRNKPGTTTSDGDYFRVTFKSNSIFDGSGFDAMYQFIPKEESNKKRHGKHRHRKKHRKRKQKERKKAKKEQQKAQKNESKNSRPVSSTEKKEASNPAVGTVLNRSSDRGFSTCLHLAIYLRIITLWLGSL